MSNIFDKFHLNDRPAIVTGGEGLLGKEFCRTLAQAGALVVVADLNEAAAQQVAESLNREGLRACAVGVDVTSTESVRAMVSAALDASGRLDVLVNSAAMDPKFDSSQQGQHGNTFEDYPVEAWRQALDVNLTGMFLCCQAASRRWSLRITARSSISARLTVWWDLTSASTSARASPGSTNRLFTQ
jgi:2-deoxy-D-gluconate 3-dehydrogenase